MPKYLCPTLNEKIIKNKKINHYYKRNDKQCFDLQNVVSKATVAVVDVGNLRLEANNKYEVIRSKDVIVKAITLLGKINH